MPLTPASEPRLGPSNNSERETTHLTMHKKLWLYILDPFLNRQRKILGREFVKLWAATNFLIPWAELNGKLNVE